MKKEQNTLALKDQKRWSFAICLIVIGVFVANIGVGIEQISGISQQFVSNASKLAIFCCLLRCVPSFIRCNILPVVLLAYSFLILTVTQVLLFPENNEWFISVAIEMLAIVFPFVLCLEMIDDFDCAMDYLVRASCILSASLLFVVIAYGGSFFSSYSMGFSDSLIFPTNVLVFSIADKRASKKSRIIMTLLALSNVWAILTYGSRGSLVAVAVCAAAQFFLFDNNQDKKKVVFKLFIMVVILLGILFFQDIVILLAQTADWFGFNSRTLWLLASEGAMHDSGRIDLWLAVLNDCLSDPIAIRGICSAYPLVGNFSHSILLDAWHNFGMLFGSVFICFVIYLLVFTVKLAKQGTAYGKTLAMLMLSAFPILLWSGTFWTNPYFWGWFVMAWSALCGFRKQTARIYCSQFAGEMQLERRK